MTGTSEERERMRARALARWEGEGGSISDPAEGLDVYDRLILLRLGAAVLGEWNTLPREYQRTIFMRASAPPSLDGTGLMTEIARFLHNHKDD